MNILGILVCFSLLFCEGYCIDCYRCTTQNDSYNQFCGENFDTHKVTYVTNCMDHLGGGTIPAHYCVKIVKTTKPAEEVKVTRDCIAYRIQEGCDTIADSSGHSLRDCIYLCDDNGCNKSSENHIGLRFILLFILFALFYNVVFIHS